jgi:hypothetical protein
VFVHKTGTAEFEGNEISDNTANRYGGGLYVSGNATLNNATVSGNQAKAGAGAYVANGGTLELRNSTVEDAVVGNVVIADSSGTTNGAPLAAPTVELASHDAESLTLSLLAPANATQMRVEISASPFATEAAIPDANLADCQTLDASAQSWTAKNLESGATYYVRVYSINADGVSAWSEVLEVKLFLTTEFVPLTLDAVSEAFVDLFAEDGEDDFWFEFEKATGARK